MDAETFRDAMRSWATGVAIISAKTNEARHGMTVNSFTSVSLDPPLVSVCIQNDLRILPMIRESGAFAISVLSAGQAELSNRFAGRSTEDIDRFADVPARTAVTGAPILVDALAYFDCKVEASYPGGTHTIVLGKVLDATRRAASGNGEGEPLVYWNRGYRTIAGPGFDRQTLMEAFEHWRHDSLHQLGLVQSWAQLMLQEDPASLPELARTAFESILTACRNAVAQWNNVTVNLQSQYRAEDMAWIPIPLDRAIAVAVERLKSSAGVDSIQVRLPEGLPAVRSTEYLGSAIETLIALQVAQQKSAPRTIEVDSLEHDRIKVRCMIATRLQDFTQKMLFHPGSEFDSARFFIHQHGSELLVTHSEQGTGFEFTLPVWHDPGTA